MKLVLESTAKVVQLIIHGVAVPARIWEGRSEAGARVHCYITRVAVVEGDDMSEFDRALLEERKPSPEVMSIPARLVL